jgi:hypothetical protein
MSIRTKEPTMNVSIDQPVLLHYDTTDLPGNVADVLRDRNDNVRQLVVRVAGGGHLVRYVPVRGSWKSLGGHSTLTV